MPQKSIPQFSSLPPSARYWVLILSSLISHLSVGLTELLEGYPHHKRRLLRVIGMTHQTIFLAVP
jgi:hypothetical protein